MRDIIYYFVCFVSSGRYATLTDVYDLHDMDDECFFITMEAARAACCKIGCDWDRAGMEIPEMAIMPFDEQGTVLNPVPWTGGAVDVTRLDMGEIRSLQVAPAWVVQASRFNPDEMRGFLRMHGIG